MKIRKIQNKTVLKKCLVELLNNIWHSIQKALEVWDLEREREREVRDLEVRDLEVKVRDLEKGI